MATSSSSNRKLPQGISKLETVMSKGEAVKLRAEMVEKFSGVKLAAIRSYSLDPATVNKNIENMIGTVQIPLGFAGPLKVSGSSYEGDALIPLATTEGALVASVNRGCKALNECGGVNARLVDAGQTRAPLFEADGIDAALALADYCRKNRAALVRVAQKGSRHLKLKEIQPHIYGRFVWLRLRAATGNAMGMNMLSIAAENLALHLERSVKRVKYLSVSGNLCTDKKPSALSLIGGRGRFVIAEASLPAKTVSGVLKAQLEDIAHLNSLKNILGSALAASYGLNGQFANVISAIYAATGQDLAHIVEGSHGVTHVEVRGGNLYVSVTLPSLQVGTVGGGTGLPAQQECIRLMGIDPSVSGAANQLAEVAAAAVLAGEISLLAALSSRQLVDAHKRLNR